MLTRHGDASRVVLHVGLPHSGTTFLRHALRRNAEALADRGVLHPQTADDVMLRAALDVRGTHKAWGRRRKDVAGAWDSLCATARRHGGTTIIGHELLASACSRQVDAALSMLKGLDVHLVVTARDPVRQLVAEWQDVVRHGQQVSFATFEAAVRSGEGEPAHRFAAAQSLPDVLNRWGRHLPPEQVHVVVAPPPGSPPDRLWAALADVAGFDPTGFPAGPEPHEEPLGADEVDLLRRVNASLGGRLRQPAYARLAEHRLGRELLTGRRTRPVQAPVHVQDALALVAEQWVKEVGRAGWTVHGDPADLVPLAPTVTVPHPDAVDPRAQVAVASDVVAALLLDLEAAHAETADAEARRRSWKKRAKRLRRTLAET
ncbi:MAG TPA: hypothetical protein VFV40_10880 [Nocardioides sp.]|nr:hypothetical protein [Nocardioides sp.]